MLDYCFKDFWIPPHKVQSSFLLQVQYPQPSKALSRLHISSSATVRQLRQRLDSAFRWSSLKLNGHELVGDWRSLQSFQSVLTAQCGLLEVGLAQKIESRGSKPSESSFKVSLGPTEVVSVSLDYKATVRDLLRTLDCDEGRLRIGDRLGAPQETLLDLGVDIGQPVSLERRLMVRAKLPPPLLRVSVRVWPSDTLAQLKAEVEAEAGRTVRSFMCDGETVEAWTCNVQDLGLRDGEEVETVLLGEY